MYNTKIYIWEIALLSSSLPVWLHIPHLFSTTYLRSWTFNHLSLVQTDAPPLHRHQRTGNGHVALLVAEAAPILAVAVGNVHVVELRAQHVVGGDDHILLSENVWLDEAVFLHTLINLRDKYISLILTQLDNIGQYELFGRAEELKWKSSVVFV